MNTNKLKQLNMGFTTNDLIILILFTSIMSLRNISLILILGQIVFLLNFIINQKGNLHIPKKYFFYYAYSLTFFLWCLFSAFWAPSFMDTFLALKSLFQIYIICGVLICYIKEEKDLEKILHFMSLAAIILIGYILIATPINDWNSMIFGKYSMSTDQGRLGTTVGMHPNALGNNCAMMILIFLYLMTQHIKRWHTICVILLFIALLFTKSRTAIILLFLGGCLYLLLYKRASIKRIMMIPVIAICAFGFFWTCLNTPLLYQLIGFRFEGLLGIFNSSYQIDASVNGRNSLIQYALLLFKEHPLTGVGMGNFSYYNQLGGGINGLYAHNNYAEMLADVGIVGFVIYYGFYIFTLYNLINAYRYSRPQKKSMYALFLTLFILRIVGDYGQMSYLSDYSQIINAICFTAAIIGRKNIKLKNNYKRNLFINRYEMGSWIRLPKKQRQGKRSVIREEI